jgi:SSS family solute:Na+ symporter
MTDNIIISGYLIVVLLVGFYKSLNIKSMREFSLADKNYSLPIMVATITATAIGGGSTMGIISSIFTYGIVYIFISFGNPVNKFITGQFFIEKLDQFDDCISVGDIMHKLYGKNARIISGICGSLYCAATVGAQVSAIGFAVHYFLGIPFIIGVLIGAGAVVLYSATGGIKAVTATDVIQFAVMLIAIPMICNVGLSKIGGYQSLFERVPTEILKLPDSTNAIINALFIFLTFSLPSLDPPETQRLLMAKDRQQIRNTLYLTVLIEVIFFILIGLIGLLAAAINPGFDANLALPHLVNTILPLGLKGIAVAGLLSVIMSTADSYLHSASICLVHDTIKPLYKKEISDRTELRLTQATTFLLGTGALILAIGFKSILGIVLFSANFWGPIMILPLYTGLMGYKVSNRCFYAGMASGIITFLYWYFMLESKLGIQSFIPSMFMSTIGFFSMHFYEQAKVKRVTC